MGWKDIKAGKFKARPIEGAFQEAQNGNMQVGVQFEFAREGGEIEKIWWIGHFTDLTMEKTFETLARLGVEGDVTTCFNGLKRETDFEIVIELQPGQAGTDKANTLYPRVRWVNDLGGRKFGGVEVETVKSGFAGRGIDFAAKLREAKLTINAGVPQQKSAATPPPKAPTNDEIFNNDKPPF